MIPPHEVKRIANNNGWRFVKGKKWGKLHPGMLEFTKMTLRIVVDCKRETVETILKHPKYGWTSLVRYNIDANLLTHIFHNPRVHTDKGYHVKRLSN